MKKKKIIIIGAALAGPTAASRAREMDENAEIILLERNTRVSYSLAGLSFHLSNEVQTLEDLNKEREEFFEKVFNIQVLTRTEVITIDRKMKILKITQESIEKEINYDTLIFATGAASIHPEGLPDAVSNFRYFRTLDDLAAIRGSIDQNKKNIIVLGGGSMGLEAVDGLVRGGANVTLLEKQERILPNFAGEIAKLAESKLRQKINLILGFDKIEFETVDSILIAVIVDGNRIETDFLVSAIGVRPRTELLQASGLKINLDGTIPIDKYARTSDKNIYACSICVSLPNTWGREWIPQAAVADKTAQIAGANSVGKNFTLGNFQASMIIRLPMGEVGRVGHSKKEIISKIGKKKFGMAFLKMRNIEPYMPESRAIYLVLYYNKKNHRVLGLDAYGSQIKSRLDAMTVAIAKGMRLEQLSQLDFSYSPAFGTARDGLNALATIAWMKQEKLTDWIHPSKVQTDLKRYFIANVGLEIKPQNSDHFHLPLEKLRTDWKNFSDAWNNSGKQDCLVISESGRRGHLAVCILQSLGISAKNILGGYELFELYGNPK